MKATGRLRHQFHGEYSAVVALAFADAETAARALPTLGEGWDRIDRGVRRVFTSDELDAFKRQIAAWGMTIEPCGRKHCKHQCKREEIDSLAHSVDYGPLFTVDVPLAEDPRQVLMALEVQS